MCHRIYRLRHVYVVDDVIYRMDLESKCVQFLVFWEKVSVIIMGVNICAKDIFMPSVMFSNKSIPLGE